jgi:hypothetical protein
MCILVVVLTVPRRCTLHEGSSDLLNALHEVWHEGSFVRVKALHEGFSGLHMAHAMRSTKAGVAIDRRCKTKLAIDRCCKTKYAYFETESAKKSGAGNLYSLAMGCPY